MFTSFSDIFASLASRGAKKRMIAAWGVDSHTIVAASKAVDLGIVEVTIVGDSPMVARVCTEEGIDVSKFTLVDNPVEQSAVAEAVDLIRQGKGDILMKGLCSTDKFLRAILNKDTGLLPPKGTLTHVGVIENPNYHKLLFLGDMAVIPAPDFKQKQIIMGHLVATAHSAGIELPKVAIIAASEQMLTSMPACMEAAQLAKMVDRGQIKGCIADGPLALDVAIDKESCEIKGLVSPVGGDADCLLFPNIESANVFYKVNSKLVRGVKQSGMMVGAKVPCVLSSRADSIETKLNSIAVAAMSAK
ncbi:MAG: phosphate butyryltransferase [Bacteroidales bacterium]|nr:phosphate butyryltransferase [Bacteroidales bacterium]